MASHIVRQPCSFSYRVIYIRFPLPPPVHLLPIQPPTQLDTPSTLFTFTPPLSASSLYNHPLSWTPLSLHITPRVHLLPIQPPTQLDTPPLPLSYFSTDCDLCPPPPYTTIHSAGHPSLSSDFTFTPPVHLPPIQPSTQLDTPPFFPTFLLYYPPPHYTTIYSAGHPTLPTFLLTTVHLLPIQPSTQLDTLPSYLSTARTWRRNAANRQYCHELGAQAAVGGSLGNLGGGLEK